MDYLQNSLVRLHQTDTPLNKCSDLNKFNSCGWPGCLTRNTMLLNHSGPLERFLLRHIKNATLDVQLHWWHLLPWRLLTPITLTHFPITPCPTLASAHAPPNAGLSIICCPRKQSEDPGRQRVLFLLWTDVPWGWAGIRNSPARRWSEIPRRCASNSLWRKSDSPTHPWISPGSFCQQNLDTYSKTKPNWSFETFFVTIHPSTMIKKVVRIRSNPLNCSPSTWTP